MYQLVLVDTTWFKLVIDSWTNLCQLVEAGIENHIGSDDRQNPKIQDLKARAPKDRNYNKT